VRGRRRTTDERSGYPDGLRGYTAGYIAKTEGYAAPDELNGVWSARVAALRATDTTSPRHDGGRKEQVT
jgi:hypothetical protein